MAERSKRAEETRRARRMKPGDIEQTGIKLAVNQDRLDPSKVYRWVKDTPGRIEQMARLDYDLVGDEVKEDSTGLGTIPSAHGGVGENGKPYGMVLMAKYKDWYEEDQKAKSKPLDEMENAIKRGNAHERSGEAELSGVAYTPGSGNSMTTNR